MLKGDFGISFAQENRRVNDIIREHFPVFRHPRDPRHRLRRPRRHPVRRTHGALPESDAGHRDHVPGHSRHLRPEFRVRSPGSARPGEAERALRDFHIAGRGMGHAGAHDCAVAGAGPRDHGIPDPAHALLNARDRQFGLREDGPVQGPADHPDLPSARTEERGYFRS